MRVRVLKVLSGSPKDDTRQLTIADLADLSDMACKQEPKINALVIRLFVAHSSC